MIRFYVGLIIAGAHFLLAYFTWKKGKVELLAGYVEGQVKDKKKLSKYAGILIIGCGVIGVFFPLVPDNSFYYVFLLYVLWVLVGVVFVNIKIK